MKIGVVSQCTRCLDFRPRAKWPSVLPSIAWNEILVAGFKRASLGRPETAVCLFIASEEFSLEEPMSSLYPNLSFLELARVADQLKKVKLEINWPDFCSRLGYHARSDWPSLFQVMKAAPNELLEWWQSHDVSPRDLAPLNALPVDLRDRYFQLAKKAVALAPSKSDGVQILEWLVDILLADFKCSFTAPFDSELLGVSTFAEFRTKTRRLRFQQTATGDELRANNIAKLPWSAKTKAAWIRQGDRDGVEIKIFSHSANDLMKQIAVLQNVATHWKDQ